MILMAASFIGVFQILAYFIKRLKENYENRCFLENFKLIFDKNLFPNYAVEKLSSQCNKPLDFNRVT